MASQASPGQRERAIATRHEGFLRHRNFLWLKVAGLLSLGSILGYVLADIRPHPNGGSWIGYTLGTIGAGLIVWLALLGVRKRAITAGGWSLKAWTSAHVWLGLSLLVVATLHTGFKFGWNVHTLAYALMIGVIASGVFGVSVYAMLPAALSANREELTQAQMIEGLAALDRQLRDAAQPLSREGADLVLAVLDDDPFAAGVWRRLAGSTPQCPTARALRWSEGEVRAGGDPAAGRIEALLRRRLAQLERVRRQLRLKALLEVWLVVHVPMTVALLAALFVHIVSVFYYW